jgi:hypothetical protein
MQRQEHALAWKGEKDQEGRNTEQQDRRGLSQDFRFKHKGELGQGSTPAQFDKIEGKDGFER